MKREVLLVLFLLCLVSGCADLPEEPQSPENLGDREGSGTYANPDGMVVKVAGLETGGLSVSGGAEAPLVYSKGYYRLDNGEWVELSVKGKRSVGNWVKNRGEFYFEQFNAKPSNKNAVLLYSCDKDSFNCNNKKWMLHFFRT